MLAYGWLVGTTVLGASVATAALLLWIVSRMSAEGESALPREARAGAMRCVMLFDGDELIDATPPARALIDAAPGQAGARERLLRLLEARFGPLHGALDDLEARGAIEMEASGARLEARWCEGLSRVEVSGEGVPAGEGADGEHLGAIEEELRLLRAAAEDAPWPIWHTGPDGVVDWANGAYIERAQDRGQDRGRDEAAGPRGWPPPPLFVPAATARTGHADAIEAPSTGGRAAGDATAGLRPGGPVRRLRATSGAGAGAADEGAGEAGDVWFDCVARAGLVPGGAMHYAAPAGSAVRAERSLEQFVQTLSKTFAHLPIGLAVFDARRGLSLFNPALADLTALPVEFLSGRPRLHDFIDRLREARRMPEPRDYRSWRERITALEAASTEGTYLETWNLPGGQTWRVSGRPHLDGAIALMFEDITAEVALTRRFRSELEVGQAVVDAMGEAIAVFAPDGVLTLANEAYARLWGSDPRTTLGDMAVSDASRGWLERAEPAPIWGELRDFVGQIGEREAFSGEARLRDGRRLVCRAVPLSAGATLLGFAAEAEVAEELDAQAFTPRLLEA